MEPEINKKPDNNKLNTLYENDVRDGNSGGNSGVKNNAVTSRLWTLNFALICLSGLFVYFGFHSLIPTLPVYILQHGGITHISGLALGVLTIAAVISRPFAGWALDNYGRKALFIGGLLFFLIPTLVFVSIIPVAMLILLRFFQGLAWGVCSTASGTVASDVVPKERLGEGMGFFSLHISVSLAIAPAIGLWLMEKYSFQALFAVSSLFIIISIILALLIRYPKTEKILVKTDFAVFEKAAFRPALIILFLTMTYSSLLSFLAVFVQKQGVGSAALFFAALAITTVVSRPLGGRIVDRLGNRGYDLTVIPGLVAVIVAMPIIAQISSVSALIIGSIVYGFGFGLVQPTMLALCINSVPTNKRGAANATYFIFFDTGVGIGSIIWGLIAGIWGYSSMFNLNMFAAFLALAVYLMMRTGKGNQAGRLIE